jgi:hypothetical protein
MKEGFEVFLLKAATRPVNHADGREAERLMERLGARIVR